MYLAGQICGMIGAVFSIARPHFRKKEHILLCGILVNALNAMNFWLIAQRGASMYLCLVAILQSAVAIRHERKKTAVSSAEGTIFLLLYLGVGFLGLVSSDGFVWGINGRNLLELMPILGSILLMLSVFAEGEQKTRICLLMNGIVWMIYTAIVGTTVFFTAAISTVSTGIALWKYRLGDNNGKGDA